MTLVLAAIVTDKSAVSATVDETEAALSFVAKSITLDVAAAVFVIVPGLTALAVSETVATPLAGKAPNAAVKVAVEPFTVTSYDPWLVCAETNTVFVGNASVTLTPVAVEGPRFDTVIA